MREGDSRIIHFSLTRPGLISGRIFFWGAINIKVKYFISLFVIVALIFTLAIIPILAIDESYLLVFRNDYQSSVNGYFSYNGSIYGFSKSYESDVSGYALIVAGSNGNNIYYFVTSTQLSANQFTDFWIDSTRQGGVANKSTEGFYNGYYYYDLNVPSGWVLQSENCTPINGKKFFSSIQDAIDNSDIQPTYDVDFILPAGNAAYIEVSSSYNGYTAYTTMPEYNPIMLDPTASGYNTGDFWPNSTQVETWANTLPTIGDLVTGSRLHWNKSGDLTILGLTNQAEYESIGPYQASGYQVIINPAYYGGTANGPYEFLANGSVRIIASGIKSVTVFQLNSTMGFTSSLGLSVTTEITDTSWDGNIDPDTGDVTWTDSDGELGSPTDGGGNLQPVTESVTGWLKNIAQQIADFFEGPIKAINILVTAIKDFVSSIKSLYLWLPTEVYSILVSAITLAITIGVIKVFI